MTGMPEEQELERVEAQAADWLTRLQADDFGDAEALAFERWLETPAHRAAFDRAEALWLDLETAAAATTIVQMPRRPRRLPRRWVWAAGAAVAASVAGLAILPSQFADRPSAIVFEAAKGRHRRLDLADGSHVDLGAGSRIRVSLDRSERRVDLASPDGEAAFDVAKDPERPFVIHAAGHAITVVGTEFDVRSAAGRLMVTVRRGVVEVERLAPGSRKVRLTPGQQYSRKTGDAEAHVGRVDPDVAFGWTGGERTYRDQPLPEVVADLNREFPTPIRVDPTAADLRFTGFLRIDEEDAVLRRLQVFLPIVVVRTPDAIILRHAPG